MRRKQRLKLPKGHFISDLPPLPNSIVSFDKQLVDTRGDRWVLLKTADGGDEIYISWANFHLLSTANRTFVRIPDRTLHIAQLFASERLCRKSPTTVNNDLAALRRFLQLLLNSKSYVVESLQWAAVVETHFREFLENVMRTANRGNDFHRVRTFFAWGVKRGIPDFSADLLGKIRMIRAPGNLTGHHVRSQNPLKGPLYREEIDLIVTALREERGTAEDRAIVMLLLELGLNPNQAARLRNDDLITFAGEINGELHHEYQLRIPRNKKRRPFRETKQRAISEALASLLRSLQGPSSSSKLLHWLPFKTPSRGINEALHHFACDAALVSPRTGKPLKLHARRLRYTLGTEAAEQGASDYHVAELLDHSNISHVKIYRKTEPTIADRMERALDPTLAPLVKKFQGLVVDRVESYPFVGIPSATIAGTVFHLPEYPLDLGGIGWCGLDLKRHGLCKKSPPLACYTCPKFAAWRDGPHKQVLQGLEKATLALSDITDKRIPQELIETRRAVHECIQQIEEDSAGATKRV
jgi:integrase